MMRHANKAMNSTLKVCALLGVALFGFMFIATFQSQERLERSAKGFIQSQIEKEVTARQKAIAESSLAEAALSLAGRLGVEKEQLESNLTNNLPEQIAAVIASMCGYSCEMEKAISQSIAQEHKNRISRIEIAESTLGDIVRGKYLEIFQSLKADLQIFLGSNLMMFLLVLTASWTRPKATQHLFLPAILLVISTITASSIYIFGQDWFYTIVYNNYMGFGYLVYILVIFAFLMDILINKARVTTQIINGVANALGSALTLVPSC